MLSLRRRKKRFYRTLLMMEAQWETLLKYVRELAAQWETAVFIGGVAVYLHSRHDPELAPEYTHDIDFYLSFAELDTLRDYEMVVPNRRLQKYSFHRWNMDFDVYTEQSHTLPVSYREAYRHSILLEGVRCACLEHLLILKMQAYQERLHSEKGNKDARDILRILALLNAPDMSIFEIHLTEDRMELVEQILRRHPLMVQVAHGNSHHARRLRQKITQTWNSIRTHLSSP